MILVDASAWVEFDRGTESATHRRLRSLISSGGEMAVSEPILMEVLAGARHREAESRLRRLLTSFSWIPVEAAADFEGAAKIYRSCRRAGITPRGLLDCMITSIAIRSGATLLTADRDFERMRRVVPLRVEPL